MKHTHAQVLGTIALLKHCQGLRASGKSVGYTDDPAWLVNMAVNRRAGWPDDPTCSRGSCMPVNGKYPRKSAGDYGYRHLCQLAERVNSRVIVRENELGNWRGLLMKRIPGRFTGREDF